MVTKTHSHQLRAVFAAVLVIFCASNVSSSGVPRYHKEVLDNGATVVAAHMSDSSLATVQIRVLSGLSNEGEYAGTGISHFMEHMIFRSLQTNGDTPLRKAVKTMGGSINGSTGQDSAEYHITVPKENFRSAMKLLTEMVMKPALDEEGVEMERDVILKEMNMIDDNPSGKQLRLLFERAYRRHVYRYPIIGHKELFLELEKEDLERYHSSVYTPDRIVLGVAGGVLPEEVFRAAGEDLGGFSRAFPWNVSIAEEPKQTVPDIFVTSADVDLGYFAIGFHSVSIYSDDVYPLSIAASILGSGVDSLLYRELVREKQLLHSVNAFNLTPGYPGLFVIQGTCEPENLEEARTEIFKMIECLMSKGVGDDDLERVKNMAVSSYLRSHESTRSVVSSMTSSSILTGGPHFFENYVEKIRGVSPGDVKEAALKYLTVSNSTTAFTVPEEIKEYLEPGRYEDISPEEKVHGIEEMVLDNGLRIIAKRNGSLPLVS
ncbi:MAG: pitrilysin family protein, partial [Candidatus Omnitrophota bacterium]